jgi:prolyl-tRNA editing enzyme YbaK/EbsC (Cys-tRNA(Pro) deacylase)
MRDKVIATARELGLELNVQSLENSTATAADAARAVGCNEAQIAKSLVFVCDGDPVLCIASGAHRVDLNRLADVFDCAEIRQAAPDEVTAATGYKVGGVPPFGHGLPVVLDEDLLSHELVWAAAGDGHSLFAISPKRLVECTGARVAAIA